MRLAQNEIDGFRLFDFDGLNFHTNGSLILLSSLLPLFVACFGLDFLV
jgi:hypothetical protein